MGLAPNDGLIRPKYPRAANTPFKNDFYNKIGPKLTRRPATAVAAFGGKAAATLAGSRGS
jgi:hypothetical protein